MGGALDAAQVLEFVDSGRDLLMAVDSRASDEMRCCSAAHTAHTNLSSACLVLQYATQLSY